MRHKTRPIITVQPLGSCAPWQPPTKAMIRLRGKWVAEIFPPYTRLRVTRELRNGELVLVLEPIESALPTGGSTLKTE